MHKINEVLEVTPDGYVRTLNGFELFTIGRTMVGYFRSTLHWVDKTVPGAQKPSYVRFTWKKGRVV